MFDFQDQVVVVTGAAGNLGQAAAAAFAQAGARLILIDRRAEALEESFPELAASGEHLFTAVDLTDSNTVEALGFELIQQPATSTCWSTLPAASAAAAPVHETDPELWDFLMDLNARTVL
jgi:NADP-dependent 3-hydroxy acid dehydrogenase YdfG